MLYSLNLPIWPFSSSSTGQITFRGFLYFQDTFLWKKNHYPKYRYWTVAQACLSLFFMAASVVSLAAVFVALRTPFPITRIHLSRMFILFYFIIFTGLRPDQWGGPGKRHIGTMRGTFPYPIPTSLKDNSPLVVTRDGWVYSCFLNPTRGKSVFPPYTSRLESLNFCKHGANSAHILFFVRLGVAAAVGIQRL